MSYYVYDLETTTTTYNKRKASPFTDKNWVVAAGYKEQGGEVELDYYTREDYDYAHGIVPTGCMDDYTIRIPETCTLLVGQNIKFDLLWSWKQPELVAFFKRGGRVWDTQYAEYLLQGMVQSAHMVAMDDIVEKYGGVLKIDEIKALWKAGVNTPDINKDLLLEYLTGDVENTEKIFLGQVAKARELGILPGIFSRMDGLCATTECEYNGLHVDIECAMQDKGMLEGELEVLLTELHSALPEFPPEFTFNWGSNVHKSCLLYGGCAKYQKWTPYLHDNGTQMYAQKLVTCLVMDDDRRIPMSVYLKGTESIKQAVRERAVTYKGGKKQGEFKTKKIKVDDTSKPKGAKKDYVVRFDRMVPPKDEWKGALTDAEGEPLYSVSGEIIQLLAANHPDVTFLKAMSMRDKIQKDLGTYYMTGEGDDAKGMLTLLDGDIIHHKLNHTSTVTSRLSSSDPNLQNVPRADWDKDLGRAKSVVKRMFTSRFDNGVMIESDYSQLEVVVQGILTMDEQIIQDINDGVDFHVKRLAAKLGEDYDSVYEKCHTEEHPEHSKYKTMRSAAKAFTFQRAFGAGKASIAAGTGMSEDEVQLLIDAEEIMYPGVTPFFDSIERMLEATRVPTLRFEQADNGRSVQCGIGYYTGLTQTRFGFYEVPLPGYKRKQTGREAGFYRPSIMNYPVQGTAGHIVQIQLGKVWRYLVMNDNYNGRALLVNTVHDCIWIDSASEIKTAVALELTKILESVPTTLKELFNFDCPVPFPCEAEYGDNLLSMKGITHEC